MRKVFILKKRTAILVLLGVLLILFQVGALVAKRAVPSLYRTPGTFYMLKTDVKLVALTFDDGPNPNFTPQILDILKENNVRATFFVLGKAVEKYPKLTARIRSEGHEIGNHGFSHDYQQARLSEDLRKTDQAVFDAAGIHTFLYRPPAGRITKQQLQLVKENSHLVTLWSVDSDDWLNPGAGKIVANVTKRVFPGSVVLLHDGGDGLRGQTVEALPSIIRQFKEMGYSFVTVGEMKSLESPTK